MTTASPLEALLDRIRGIAGDATAERLLPDLNQFFEQFQLVPKSTFDNHLTALRDLNAQVQLLEERLAELEAR